MNAFTQRNKKQKDEARKLIKDLIIEKIQSEVKPALDATARETAATIRKTTVAEVLYALHEKGMSKDFITECFEDVVMIDHRQTLYNKTISNYDALDFMVKTYGLDFDRLDTDFAVKIK